jgi:hypothetical protein
MMKMSELQSSKNKIEMVIEIDEVEFKSFLPSEESLSPIEEKYQALAEVIVKFRDLVNDEKIDHELFLAKQKHMVVALRNAVIDVREQLDEVNNLLANPCVASLYENMIAKADPHIENLHAGRFEIESLVYIGKLVRDTYDAFKSRAMKRIEEYTQLLSLIKKPLNGVLVFEDDKNYSFHVTKFGYAYPKEQNAQVAHWKELIDVIILRGIERQVLISMDIRDNFLMEMGQLFRPIASFEEVLTLGEFLRARGEVMNFWSENFTYTEGFNYHFFKSLGFFENFEKTFLAKINGVHQKVLKRFELFKKNDPSLTIDSMVNVNLKQFLEKPFILGDSSISSEDEMRYFYANMMDAKKAEKFLKHTANSFAKKLNGTLISERTIARPVSKGSYRTELVVIAFNNDNAPATLHISNKMKDLCPVKSEEYSDRITSENGNICFDADYKISYFLSTTEIKQVA